jgi:hypothetical protein
MPYSREPFSQRASERSSAVRLKLRRDRFMGASSLKWLEWSVNQEVVASGGLFVHDLRISATLIAIIVNIGWRIVSLIVIFTVIFVLAHPRVVGQERISHTGKKRPKEFRLQG